METYRKICKILRKHCPLAFPVTIRRVKLQDDGDCAKHKDKFIIRINSDLPECQAIDTLMHEWAHARAWNHLHDSMTNEEFTKKSHDSSWGVAYSEVYQTFEKYYAEALHCEELS